MSKELTHAEGIRAETLSVLSEIETVYGAEFTTKLKQYGNMTLGERSEFQMLSERIFTEKKNDDNAIQLVDISDNITSVMVMLENRPDFFKADNQLRE